MTVGARVSMRSGRRTLGRFGGGWNYALGVRLNKRSPRRLLLIDLLVFDVVLELARD